MNERIEELSRIAKDWASDTMMEYNSNDSVEPIDFIFFYTKEFAELIVKECAEIAKHHVSNISTYSDAEFVDEQIKEHFGVKE